jgi:hypothetical protein
MRDANERWSGGWGWLLVIVVVGVFLRWAALSCYHDSIDSKGPGGGITWIIMAGFYGVGYALLLPAYFWLISSRPLWGTLLVLPPVGISFAVLFLFTNSRGVPQAVSWSQVANWPNREAAYGPYHLLGSICFTLLVVVAGMIIRLLLYRRQASETFY